MVNAFRGQNLHLLTNKALTGINKAVEGKFAGSPKWLVEFERKKAILEFAEANGIRFNVYKDDKSQKELVLAAAARYVALNQPLAEQHKKGGKSHGKRQQA